MAPEPKARKFLRDIGIRLRRLRYDRGWTLEETENHGWNNWQHLQAIETGKKSFTMATLLRLSKLYTVSPGRILEN